MAWEQEFDCVAKFKEWILSSGLASENELSDIETVSKKEVNEAKKAAWEAYLNPIKEDIQEAASLLDAMGSIVSEASQLAAELRGNK